MKLSPNEILKNNKLIAEFMEFEKYHIKDKNDGYLVVLKKGYIPMETCVAKLQFHSSWDWLMPVVEKIEDLDYNELVSHTYSIEITGNGSTAYKNICPKGESNIIYRFNLRNNRLKCTWIVIIEFIKWYNNQKTE